MPRPAFPKSLREFQRQFATEDACEQYLAASRWPDGFLCERCGGRDAYVLVDRRRWQCTSCRHQVSLTSGSPVVLGGVSDDDRHAGYFGGGAAAPARAPPQ